MNDDRVVLTGDLRAAIPDLLDKWTGRVVLLGSDADLIQLRFYLEGRAEGRDEDDIVGSQGFKRDQLFSIGVLEEPDPQGLQVGIDLRVMDHFAQEEDAAAGVVVGGAERDLDGVLHPITESEVAGEVDAKAPRSRVVGVKSFFILSSCLRRFLMAAIRGLR